MRAWERENTMYPPIDFYPATLAMSHLALSLSPSTSYRISPHMIVKVDLKYY